MNKCLDSKWLQLTDSMIKTRNSHLFRTEILQDFSMVYMERRGDRQYIDMSVVTAESLAKVFMAFLSCTLDFNIPFLCIRF